MHPAVVKKELAKNNKKVAKNEVKKELAKKELAKEKELAKKELAKNNFNKGRHAARAAKKLSNNLAGVSAEM